MIDGASGSENRFVVDSVDRTNAPARPAITAVNNQNWDRGGRPGLIEKCR
jgi:hypothetical protein